MADTHLPPFRTAPTPAPISPATADTRYPRNADPIEETEADERVRRLRGRFLYAWHHPKWVKWRREGKEDFEFVAGTGQWPEDVRRQLESKGKPTLTINVVRPVIQTVVGYERAARLEPKPIPEVMGTSPPSEAIIQNVQILGRLMKRVSHDQEADFVQSDGFKDGVTCGLGAWYVGVDYSDDLVNGRPEITRIPRGEFLYDPDAKKYDLSDAREAFWHKLVPIEALQAQFPRHAQEIEDALYALPADTPGATHELPTRDPYDGYRTHGEESALVLWDWDRREVRVIHTAFQVWTSVHLLIDKRQNRVEEIPDDPTALSLARALAEADPEVRVVAKQRREWYVSIFLPATNQELYFGQPFDNDREDCPFVQFKAYEEEDEILGLVRNLKDPQREVNKRRSAMVDNVGKHGSLKWFAKRSSLENPEFLEGAVEAGDVGWTKTNPLQERPVEVAPPAMPAWVVQQDQEAKAEVEQISGVNMHLQGRAKSGESGRKVQALQQQGQVQVSEIFDNYRRSRRLLWRRVGRRIQQTFTSERVIRLETEAGDSEWVTLNQTQIHDDGTVTVERDIPSLRWDVEITESAATPTARAAMLAALMEFANQFPDYRDAIADLVIEASDFPARKELVQRVRTVQQAKGIVPAPGQGQMPGAGGPPGARPGAPPPPPGTPPRSAPRVGLLAGNLGTGGPPV